jgi:hypothetical protein
MKQERQAKERVLQMAKKREMREKRKNMLLNLSAASLLVGLFLFKERKTVGEGWVRLCQAMGFESAATMSANVLGLPSDNVDVGVVGEKEENSAANSENNAANNTANTNSAESADTGSADAAVPAAGGVAVAVQ